MKQFETEHDALRRAIAEKEQENRKIEEESARQRKEQEEENARQKRQNERMLETITLSIEQERLRSEQERLRSEQERRSMEQEEENRRLRRELDLKNQKQGITPDQLLSGATAATTLIGKVIETVKVIIGDGDS